MTKQEIYSLLSQAAPTYYSHAPIGTKLPFITYTTDHSNNFGADDRVYKPVTGVRAVLYMAASDTVTEQALNELLDDDHIYWTSEEDYNDDNELYTIIYEMEVI